jgi:SOS-response transcriptional repressor LexA
MKRKFRDGDIIIVNPHIKPDHGDYVVLKNAEDEAIFKQLRKYGKARILHPLNPNYPDIELSDEHQYRVIGKVVEKKKRY